jgi:hypothetical protein
MQHGLTTLAIGVWLAAIVPSAFGQEGRVYPAFPNASPYAGQAMISNMTPPNLTGIVPSVLPVEMMADTPAPTSPTVPSTTAAPTPGTTLRGPAQSVWNLGDYGPVTQQVAGDLYPPGQTLGWYAGFEIGILKPHLYTHLSTPAGFVGPLDGPIGLPVAPLDWAGVPEVSVGYRFGQGSGEARLSYRLLDTTGSGSISGLGVPGPVGLQSRLSVQTLDFDYIIPEFLSEGRDISRFFFRELRGGVGIRAASAFFDTQTAGNSVINTHVSSNFGGVGPRMFLELHQDLLGRSDFQFYTRVSASSVIGPIIQQYSQSTLAAPGGGPAFGSYDTHNKNIGSGILQVQAGFSWEPSRLAQRLRFTGGYSWERWWNFADTDGSRGELTIQGLMLRAEYRY